MIVSLNDIRNYIPFSNSGFNEKATGYYFQQLYREMIK